MLHNDSSESVTGNSGKRASKSRNAFLSRSPRAPFQSSTRTMGHQHPGGCVDRNHCQRLRLDLRNSATVIKESLEPECLVNSAIRFRRLNSVIAVTMASRLVLACVNLMASVNSFSGISSVVFMIPEYRRLQESSVNDPGFQENKKPPTAPDLRDWRLKAQPDLLRSRYGR